MITHIFCSPILKSSARGALAWAGLAAAASAVEVNGTSQSLIIKGSFWDIFASGGPVMYPLLLCSLVAMAYALERFMALRRAKIIPEELRGALEAALEKVPDGAGRVALAGRFKGGATPGEKLVARFLIRQDYDNARDMEQILQEYTDAMLYELHRNIKPLAVITQASPLLGLLGSVHGMILAFNAVGVHGFGKPEILANGMATALFTTFFGLAIAIPSAFFHHHLKEKATRLALDLYNTVHELGLALVAASKGRG